ncbi:baseplate J/gp47 family protein [Pasteurellaceae bacterium HPA106]|uniref:baseplate J/gp47 family protein n=1 Tax=Spirabiliibacterium pneumoniae TaxID=221400 RepID=UPI001AAD9C7C|nr:baseplate J/gp47 family protein [Spirabiliibacterium pneumoniae]MBE2895448.1 baseplate J/gp47 family protein [Spirabiliibacterium pneumoniae]
MYLVPTLDDIRTQILRDYQSLVPTIDVNVDSDTYARASALASVAEGLYSHQKWLIRQFFPDTADSQFLEKHAGLRGIKRRAATYAEGRGVVITGNENAQIPVGLQIKTDDNRFYSTTESAVISSSCTVTVAVKSLATGLAQNITQATTGHLMAAPAGVSSDVSLNNIIGATDSESDASLLNRLLERIRRPPAGGNQYDYKNWALEVDGVEAAYIYPLRRGLGTVDIAITSNNDLPSDDTVRRCQAYIDEVRPVTAKESKVVKPDATKVNFTIQVKLQNITLSEIKRAIQAALTDYFNTLTPGDDLIVSQCEAIISDLVGVVDRKLITPSENKTADVRSKIEWFRLGTVDVTEM